MRTICFFGLMAFVFFGAFSCAGGGGSGEAVLSKPQIFCQAGPDCGTKWAKANAWVTENSGLKIQSKSDAQIKTVQSPQNDSRTLVVTITKNATSKRLPDTAREMLMASYRCS